MNLHAFGLWWSATKRAVNVRFVIKPPLPLGEGTYVTSPIYVNTMTPERSFDKLYAPLHRSVLTG